ncbi:MAG: hypothetical protein ACFB16_25615 [Phormidesmis sp.]
MRPTYSNTRVDSNHGRSTPVFGRVYWSSTKSIWISLVTVGAVLGGYATFTWSALALCLVTSVIVLGAGYSVGLHRLLIHNSFQCPRWLEHLLVYLGVLGSTVGPYSAIEQHDLHDWAHRQPKCHTYFSHRQNPFLDWYWSLHCDIQLAYPPIIRYEPRIAQNRFYHWIEQTRIVQQLPLAIAFYYFGGWSWVFWGIYVRIFACTHIQWLTQYLSYHQSSRSQTLKGDRPQKLETVGVQVHNLPLLGLLTLGEGWQNNHQAFPNSACFSLRPNQYDPSWWLIKAFKSVGLAWNIKHSRVHVPVPIKPAELEAAAQIQAPVTSRQKVSAK